MSPKRVAGSPDPALGERARATIVHYTAGCRECEFTSLRPLAAHAHVLTTGHSMTVQKNYVLERP